MTFWNRLRSWVLAVLSRTRVEREMDAELRFHIEARAEDLLRDGVSREEALRRARIEFGGLDRTKEECRDARGVHFVEGSLQDLRHGFRILWKSPGFTAAAVLSLALGIAATSVLFSILDGAYIHFGETAQANRVILLQQELNRHEITTSRFSPAEYFDIAPSAPLFDGIFALDHSGAALTEGSARGENPEQVPIVRTTANIFSLYGVKPLQGTTYTEEEDRPGGPRVAVLTYRLWSRRFASNPNIVGRNIKLDGVTYTVIGISPRRFQHWGADIYVPLGLDRASANRTERTLTIAAVLRERQTLKQVTTPLQELARRIEVEYGGSNPEYRGLNYHAVDVRNVVVGDLRGALYVLFGAVAFLLLVAAANVANLLLVRTLARAREIGTRLALGANPTRLARQFLTESLLLSAAAGVLGALLGIWVLPPVLALIPAHYIGEEAEVHASPSALLVSLAVALLLGMAFGTAPGLFVARKGIPASLGRSRSSPSSDRSGSRIRGLLVACEMALAFVVVTGASLMLRSYRQITTMDLGFQPDHVLTMRVSLPNSRYRGDSEVLQFVREVSDRVRPLAGVVEVAAASTIPMENRRASRDFSLPGRDLNTPDGTAPASFRVVTPDYLSALRIPLRAGRFFSEQDNAGTQRVAVVNEKFTQTYFASEGAVGKKIRLGRLAAGGTLTAGASDAGVLEIVGIVGDSRHFGWQVQEGLYEPASAEILVPFAQQPERDIALLVRTRSAPDALAQAVTAQVLGLRPDQPVYDVQPLQRIVNEALGPVRLCLLLLGMFACTALITACIGLYAIASYGVSQRTQEIGVRMALGARRSDIAYLIAGSTLWSVAAGLGAGLLASFLAARLMSSLMYGVGSNDLTTLGSVSFVLIAVAFLASYIPARRAMRVDPLVALRYE